jgi:hypothetical protein
MKTIICFEPVQAKSAIDSKIWPEVKALITAGHRVTVTYGVEEKKRSIDQNAIGHAWYQQIAAAMPQETALGWKCFCKLHFGVPILRSEDAEFRAAYDRSVKGLLYEQKLAAMEILPVTSLMNTKQKSAYLEKVQTHFFNLGVPLEFPGGFGDDGRAA